VVSFIVSPQGEWINGQVIRANGGLAAWERERGASCVNPRTSSMSSKDLFLTCQ
jgi:hypothetical protein